MLIQVYEIRIVLRGGDLKQMMGQFREKLPEKVRKNGVRAIEVLVTGSPEKLAEMTRAEQDAYFEDAKKWVGESFGGEQNIFCTAIHRDEKTPHMHVLLVPMAPVLDKDKNDTGEKKLSCNTYMKNRKTLSDMQTSFAEVVGEKHGLTRGVKGSKAKHQTIQSYYSKLNEGKESIHEIIKPKPLNNEATAGKKPLAKFKAKLNNALYGRVENPEEVIDRLAEKAIALESDNDSLRHDDKYQRKTLRRLSLQLEKAEPLLELNKVNQDKALEVIKEMKGTQEREDKERSAERRKSQNKEIRGYEK